MTNSSLVGKKRVKFEIKSDQGNTVYVAGTFNGWDPKKNKLKFKNGVHSTTILLAKGRHEYKFVINGIWHADPECLEWIPNGTGSLNSVKHVG